MPYNGFKVQCQANLTNPCHGIDYIENIRVWAVLAYTMAAYVHRAGGNRQQSMRDKSYFAGMVID